jgi:hypothetical protein
MQSLYRDADGWASMPKKWMKAYTNAICSLAEVMSGIHRATHGKADEVRAEVAGYVS